MSYLKQNGGDDENWKNYNGEGEGWKDDDGIIDSRMLDNQDYHNGDNDRIYDDKSEEGNVPWASEA